MSNDRIVFRRTTLRKVIYTVLILIVFISSLCGCGNIKKKHTSKHRMIYGLTIDDAWYDDTKLNDVIKG